MPGAALVVANDRAGRGAAAALRRALRVLGQGYAVRVVTPASHAALRESVGAAREELVVAAGGDGTVNLVVSALKADATLGVLPMGTANDFACEVGVPRDPVRAAEAMRAQRDRPPRRLDLVRANGRPLLSVGGLGLVTRTTAAVTRAKTQRGLRRLAARVMGSAIYRAVTAGAILGGRDLTELLEIELATSDGSRARWSGGVHALFVVNHPRCGGGLALPTRSRGDDGVFELGLVVAGSRPALVGNFLRLSRGTPVSPDAFAVMPATEAVIRSARPLTFAADGELLDTGDEFRIAIEPRALGFRGIVA